MDKLDFLYALQQKLAGLPEEDVSRSLDYYAEMIDDRIEDGMTEQQAVEDLGDVDAIAQQILLEIPLAKLVRAKVKPHRALRAWEIVLLILGAPVWLPLVIAAVAVVISIYIVLWSVVISLYAADLAVACGAVAGVTVIVAYLIAGNFPAALLFLGAGLVCAGLAIFMLLAFNQVTRGVIALGKLILIGIKRCFVRGGDEA